MAQPNSVTVLPTAKTGERMANRWEVTKAVRASTLPAPSRLIMLTLADVAEVGTAEIPERHTPSLTVLANETGLDRSTVRRHLAALEDAGWIVRMRPDVAAARALGERTRYRLTVPAPAKEPAPKVRKVGAPRPQVEAHNPQPGGTQPPPVGAENTTGRGTVPLNKNRSTDQSRSKNSRDQRGGETKTLTPRQQMANDIVADWWTRHGKGQSQSFIAIRKLIETALGNEVERNALVLALERLGRQKRALSAGVIQNELGAGVNGRASPGGAHTAYQNPIDPAAYEEGL